MCKARCRVGDMAIIIKSRTFPQNLGREVEVLRQATDEDCCDIEPGAVVWMVRARTPLIGAWANGEIDVSLEWPYDDIQLLPLRPRRTPRAVSRKQPVETRPAP